MSAEDKFSIQEAISRYFFALDALEDPNALAGCFTENAVWECYNHGQQKPFLRLDSRKQMEQVLAMEAANAKKVLLRHHLSGLVFEELSADRARTRCKVLVTAQEPDAPAPRVRNTAVCEGEWTRTAQGWLLSRWSIFRGPAA